MGILDFLMGNDQTASPWGALYQQPPQPAAPQIQYDQLGNVISGAPAAPDPFGPIPVAPQAAPIAPQSPFGPVPQGTPQPSGLSAGGVAPFGFAGPSSIASLAPGMITTDPQQSATAPAPAPQGAGATVAPATTPPVVAADDQADPINVGNYAMPRVGSADSFEPDDSIPANATPTQGRLPPGAAVPGAPAPSATAPFSLGGSIADASSGIGSRLGAGFRGMAANAPSGPIGAILGGVAGLAGMGQPTAEQKQAVADNATSRALLAKNVDPATVQAAILSARAGRPEILQTLITQNFGPDKFQHVTKKDAFGGETVGAFDPTTGKTKFEGDGAAAGGGGGVLAPGVKAMDSTLTGKDYLAQFSPEIQAAVQNYIDGKSTPTGNPRQGFTQTVKMIAQKYGSDIGTPADDANYSARRTMRNQLSSSAPSSLGGQINIGNTAAGHLADLTEKAVELGNYDTGIAPVTAVVNGVRGLGTEQAAKMEALKGAAQHYGQEITKFYAGSPGGTAERDRFIESVNGARSPKELAAILSTEGELMRSRLDALGGQIKGVLGEDGAAQYPVLRPDGQAALAKVQENVAKLRGGGSAAAPPALPSGWSVQVH